ncbi:hypothetical protein RIF29_07206 [Crotalaria pallida]|uniref:beta-galactosidase n=1 Tax=Crotalaria pallida TaxID=3830 RepID=A0AAN9PBA5_CROPI
MAKSLFLCLLLCFCFVSLHCVNAVEVTHDGRAIKIDGKRRLLISGSIHYTRSTPEMWPSLIQKAKEGGLDAIETYVFWDSHEPTRRVYDFNGNNDLIRFLKTIQEAGLYSVIRIGPYVCAEWNYGGIPVWVHNLPGVEIRTANDVYMNEMQNFTTLIVDMVKKEKLFASQGGNIILSQIENEYGNVISSYGDAGKAYINWCANMADSLDIGVPWIMCQQADAPQPMINTCNGWYCDDFEPNNPNSPKMWTENWVGWFKSWGGKDPHRTVEDVAFAVARFIQRGGTFQNYYMYHGGTNFGRTAAQYIATSYDYDAPLDEYGNIAQPKWGHLKELHAVLKSMEESITNGNVSETDFGNSVTATVYAANESSSCFLSNTNTTTDATITFRGRNYTVPAWSVTLLPDCENEEYNTAKVNAQTSLMIKEDSKAEDEPISLKWVWRPENIDVPLLGSINVSTNSLLDQKDATNDASDYLWYITRLDIDQNDPVSSDDMSLRINGSGHVIHAFINGEYIDSHWAKYGIHNDQFETRIKMKPGKNIISLLSVTVGLANYGGNFDKWHAGLVGPVEVVSRKGDETIIKDLSAHKWMNKVGLHGWHNEYFSEDSIFAPPSKWESEDLPSNRMLTWYKTTFKAPLGLDPIVVDLQGMGKGFAWVNGQNIGRIWPSFIADEDGCSNDPCDYRGSYSDSKCVSNCGQPTQRWYHVPRSFLVEDGVNTLVLFEEIGGNPSLVKFQTVTIGSACGNAHENKTLELSCQGRPISAIKFASFGDPQGVCGAFFKGSCESKNDALSIVQAACVGKETCSIDVSHNTFGPTTCGDIGEWLAVEAVC